MHCVIIGFSIAPYNKPKKIFIDERYQIAKKHQWYLLDAANVYVESRNKPICNIPEIGIGNKPIDGGYYHFLEKRGNGRVHEKKNLKRKNIFARGMDQKNLLIGHRDIVFG